VGLDLDPASIDSARRRLAGLPAPPRLELIHASFVEAPRTLAGLGLAADVVLADLGFSSDQMDDPSRGFSFAAEGPLDMRFDPAAGRGPTAAELLARWSEQEIARALRTYGEEPLARAIARKLARSRDRQPIRTTADLTSAVIEAYGARARTSRMHPATRTFMALRIAVNDELAALRVLLEHVEHGAVRAAAGGWLRPGARVAILSFHSLEDRLVKKSFASLAERGLAARITRRPVTAAGAEIAMNPRARSAKLRAVRIDGHRD
jgi:16S rRNA (cytosine1402-N4)-methyltransferase